jgi:hypothetical protein
MKKFLGKSIFKATGWQYNVDPKLLEKKTSYYWIRAYIKPRYHPFSGFI